MINATIDAQTTGSNIKRLFLCSGLSIESFAEEVGVSERTIYKWFKGDAIPKTDNLIVMKYLFHANLDDILIGINRSEDKEKGDANASPFNFIYRVSFSNQYIS